VIKFKLLLYFLRLGFTAFGGPLAIIAQLQLDLVENKKLVTEKDFKESLSLIKSLPGPVATQVLTFNAYRIGGLWFSLIATILFVLPSFLMMVLLAAYYDQFRTDPQIMLFLDGMQAGALVLIAVALYSLTKGNLKQSRFWIFFFLSVILLGPLKVFEPIVIVGAGVAGILTQNIKINKNQLKSILPLDIFLVCLKAGGLVFGTGFAIIPLLQNDFVNIHQWVTKDQFMDAIAFGQLTPGPVTITVSFVGYRAAGWMGASLATFGVFLPGVFNMTTWFPRAFSWFSKQSWVKAFVTGATAAIAAGIVVAIFSLSETTSMLKLIVPILIFVVSLKKKIPSWAIVIGSGAGWWIFWRLLHS